MDEFLIPYSNFKRLYEEYKKYGSISIGLDFDNTVYDFHRKGYTYDTVLGLIRRAQSLGMKIHPFTANPDHAMVITYLASNGIAAEPVNSDGVKLGWDSRKPFYSLLLDDRAGLISAVEDLERLVNVLEDEKMENLAVDEEVHRSN